MESVWIDVNGLSWHVRKSFNVALVDPPPLVMVHGLGVASHHMVPTARRLAADYQIYAPDLPGFGASEHPPRALTVPDLADRLHTWLGVMGLARVPLIADSFGSQVVADLALRYPARVERLVLISPTIDRHARTARQQMWRAWRDQSRELRPEPGWVFRAYFFQIGPRRAIQILRHALRDRIEEKLPHLRQPALVVRGSRDPIVPRHWAEEVARLLPCGRLVVIPGAAHKLNYGASRQLARVVRPFLRRAGDGAGTPPARGRMEH
jgi:pimeloyl-ACP methyl ester carboxylesterase